MALTPGSEHNYGGEVRDSDGRLIVVGPNGVAIAGGGSSGGDASAANQTAQIALETAVRDRLPSALNADGGLPTHVQNFPATQPVSGTVALSNPTTNPETGLAKDATLTTRLPATNADGGLPTHVQNFPASQAVTGPLTDTQLRATAVPVSLASAPTTAVTGPLTDTQLRATAVPVTGSGSVASPATGIQTVQGVAGGVAQPVSLATAPTTPVTGTFFQATQPVSAAALPLPTGAATDRATAAAPMAVRPSDGAAFIDPRDVSDRAARVLGVVSQAAANLGVTATAATGVAATATLPAVAGQFHYITLIEIQLYATAARTGGASPVLVTTTNLPGSMVWDFDTAQAIGTTIRQASQLVTPLKSSTVNTATTIVAPIATTGIWRINVYYYTAA